MTPKDQDADVLILGSGIAGLATALALSKAHPELSICIVERDHPPSSYEPEQSFFQWPRKGASQFRHSHIFISRLFVILRDQFPDLLASLFKAGASELTFEQTLPSKLRPLYHPIPGDEDLSLLSCRRSTFESILWRHVSQRNNVRLQTGTRFDQLILDGENVRGARFAKGSDPMEFRSQITVDALGRTSSCFDQLKHAGLDLSEEQTPTGILYYTRHYRFRPDRQAPSPGPYPMAADDGYLKYGIFRGDNGHFSLILCCPESETALRKRMLNPTFFDSVLKQIPATAPWIENDRSAPVSRIYAMGSLDSHWRYFMAKGTASVRNFFAVGDSHLRSNPNYGRGCTIAFIMADALAQTISRSTDPGTMLRVFEHRIARDIRPYYDEMIRQDHIASKRIHVTPHSKPTLQKRLTQHVMSAGVMQSIRTDIDCFRDAMRSFLMLDPPMAWLRKPRNLSVVAGNALIRPNGGRITNRAIPHRSDLFKTLEISEAS